MSSVSVAPLGDANRIIEGAKDNVMRKEIFFTQILMRQKKVESREVEKMMVDGDSIFYNPEYIASLKTSHAFFDMLCATGHNVLKHPERCADLMDLEGETFNAKLFNKAAGICVINLIHECAKAREEKLGHEDEMYSIPEGYSYHPEYKDQHVEFVYKQLKQLADDSDDDSGQGQGQGQGMAGGGQGGGDEGESEDGNGQGGGGKFDDSQQHTPNTSPCHIAKVEGDKQERKNKELKKDMQIKQAQMVAKGRGNMPGSVETTIDEITKPKVDPRSVLSRFLCDTVRSGQDWSRPSRRYTDYPVYMPRKKSENVANNIITCHDTSGSEFYNVPAQIATVFGFYDMIQTEGGTPDLEAVYCDTAVRGSEVLHSRMKPTPKGGGGTYLPPAFEWIVKEKKRPKGVIYFTDGYVGYDEDDIVGEYGREVQRMCPILWILSCHNQQFENAVKKLRFGECIYMDIRG